MKKTIGTSKNKLQSVKVASFIKKNNVKNILTPYFDLIDVPVYVTDTLGNFAAVNQAFITLTGFSKEQLIGEPLTISQPETDIVYSLQLLQLFKTKIPVLKATLKYLSKDGTQNLFKTSTALLTHTDKKKYAITSININETEVSISRNKKFIINDTQYKALVENSIDNIIILAKNANAIYLSPGIYPILGYSKKELIKLKIISLIHLDDKDAAVLIWKKIISLPNKRITNFICRVLHKDGSWRWIENNFTNMLQHNSISGIVNNFKDITEKRKMDEDIQASKSIYQTLFYNNPSAVFSLDMEGNFTSANQILLVKTGCSEEQLLKMHYASFIHPQDIAEVDAQFKYAKKGVSGEYKIRVLNSSGILIHALLMLQPIIVNEKIIGIYCLANDITEDVTSKDLLNKTLAERQRILDYSLDVICEFDENGIFMQVSKACKNIWGYEQEELLGTNYINLVKPEDKESSIKMFAIIAAGGGARNNFKNSFKKKDGSFVSLIWSARWNNHIKTMYCIAKDGTDTKNQEQSLILSEQRYRHLFYNNPLPLCIFNFSTHYIVEINEAAIIKYGYVRERFLFHTITDICVKEDVEEFEKLLNTEASFIDISKKIWRHTKKNGEVMFMNITGNMIDYKKERCAFILLDDVTEKLKAENYKEFERNEKIALINNTVDQIWSVDKDFKLIAGNNSFINSIKNYNGKVFKQGDYVLPKDIFRKKDLRLWSLMYRKALKGSSFTKEIHFVSEISGKKYWLEVSFNPIYQGENIIGTACYNKNITESKLYHNQLVTINKKLETAQQMAKLGYWEMNIKDAVCFWSDEIFRITGLKKISTVVPFNKIIKVIHPADKEFVLHNYELAIKGKTPLNCEHRILLKDGSIKILVQKATLVYNKKGEAVLMEGTTQDITRQKLAEKILQESEVKYRMIFNMNPLPNWIYDPETFQVLEVNNAAIAHYGYSVQDFLNMSIKDLFLPAEFSKIIKAHKNISYSGIINFGEWHHIKKNGEIINVNITGHVIDYNNKKAIIIISNDITEIIASKNELAKSIERFEYATKASSDAIWEHDLINDTVFWGEGFKTLFGYAFKENELNGSSWLNYAHPDDTERVKNSLRQILKDPNGMYWQDEYRFKTIDGTYVHVTDCALVLRDSTGFAYRTIGAMQNNTERRQNEITQKNLNLQLNIRAKELAISNAELEQFAYVASHDLQEPLRMITGFLNEIQKKYDPLLDDTGRSYIRFAVDGAVRMRKIIQDLLEYSRVGTQQFKYEKIDTNILLNEVIDLYASSIHQKNIMISYKDLPKIIAARIPIQQLFQNLISNAIKYQRQGVIPQINISGIENDNNWYFSIADNGIGIDSKHFKNIFVLFKRLHNKDEYSGTGIGLATCKKIIDNHKGKLWVSSVYGSGSIFYFSIPKIPIDN